MLGVRWMKISPSPAPARHPIPTRSLSSQIPFVLSCSTATRWEEPLVAGGSSAAHKVKPPPPPRLLVELVEPSSQPHAPIASKALHAPADSSQEEPAQHRRGPCRCREELVVELHPSCTSSMRRDLQLGEVLHHAARPCRQEEHSVPHPHGQSSMGGSCAAALRILVFRDAQPEENGFCPGSPISLSAAAPRKTEGGARRRRRPPVPTRVRIRPDAQPDGSFSGGSESCRLSFFHGSAST